MLSVLILGGNYAEYGAGSELMGINPNNYGSMFVGLFALILPLLSWRLTWAWPFAMICLANAANSRSMAAILTAVGITVVYLFSKRTLSTLISILLLSIIGITGWSIFGDKLPQIGFIQDLLWAQGQYEQGDYNAIVTGRFVLWGAAKEYLAHASLFQWVFGSGYGGFASSLYQSLRVDLDMHPHNHILQRLLDGGLISLGLYLALMGSMLRDSWRVYTRHNAPLALGVFLMVLSYLFMDLAGPRFVGRALFFILPPIAIFYNRYSSVIGIESLRSSMVGVPTTTQPNIKRGS